MFPPLILLTKTVRLADEAFSSMLSAIINPVANADSAHRLLTLLVVLDDRPGWSGGLGKNGMQSLISVKKLGPNLIAAMEKYGFEEGMKTTLSVLIERYVSSSHIVI